MAATASAVLVALVLGGLGVAWAVAAGVTHAGHAEVDQVCGNAFGCRDRERSDVAAAAGLGAATTLKTFETTEMIKIDCTPLTSFDVGEGRAMCYCALYLDSIRPSGLGLSIKALCARNQAGSSG
jgi:hypothetical protein